MTTLRQLHEQLNTASPYTGNRRSAEEQFLLSGEQNIHLLRAYFVERFKGNPIIKEMPKEEEFYNPAALLELFDTAEELFYTYRKRKMYLGVPDDILKIMETFHGGAAALRKFIDIISSVEVTELCVKTTENSKYLFRSLFSTI